MRRKPEYLMRGEPVDEYLGATFEEVDEVWGLYREFFELRIEISEDGFRIRNPKGADDQAVGTRDD